MADRPVITFPPTILERDDFLVLALLDYFARDRGALDERTAMRELVAIAVEQDIAKNGFITRFTFEQIDIDDVALGDAMLSAARFDNCVSHGRGKSRARSHGGELLTSETLSFDLASDICVSSRAAQDGEGPHNEMSRHRERENVQPLRSVIKSLISRKSISDRQVPRRLRGSG
jgi:hypothetical protein